MTIQPNGKGKEHAMKVVPRFIGFREFAERSVKGWKWAFGVAVVSAFFCGIVGKCIEENRQRRIWDNEFPQRFNRAALFFRDGRAEGIDGLEYNIACSDRSYLEFLWVLANNQPRQAREKAFLHFYGVDEGEAGKVPLGVWKAITDEHYTATARLESVWQSDFRGRYGVGAALNYVKGKDTRLIALCPDLTYIYWWIIGAELFLGYALVCFIMARGYAQGWAPGYKNSLWDLPRSVVPFFLMLLFAPAFAVPWALRGLYHGLYQLALRPTRAVTRWVNRGAKASEIYEQCVRFKTRKARQVRQELITSGADVLAARAEIAALTQAAKCVADKGQREALLAKLNQIKSWVEEVVKNRANGQCANIPEQVNWLSARVAALHEGEFNRLR